MTSKGVTMDSKPRIVPADEWQRERDELLIVE
jgi:hypothetical protein